MVLAGNRIPWAAPTTAGGSGAWLHSWLSPKKFLDWGQSPGSSFKSPMIPATSVLPLDFGGPGQGDQPSRKREGGRGRSCERESRGRQLASRGLRGGQQPPRPLRCTPPAGAHGSFSSYETCSFLSPCLPEFAIGTLQPESLADTDLMTIRERALPQRPRRETRVSVKMRKCSQVTGPHSPFTGVPVAPLPVGQGNDSP